MQVDTCKNDIEVKIVWMAMSEVWAGDGGNRLFVPVEKGKSLCLKAESIRVAVGDVGEDGLRLFEELGVMKKNERVKELRS